MSTADYYDRNNNTRFFGRDITNMPISKENTSKNNQRYKSLTRGNSSTNNNTNNT